MQFRHMLAVAIAVALGLAGGPTPAVGQEPSSVPPDRPGGTFQDDNASPHEPYVEALARDGVLRGCQPVAPWACPGDDLTRAQMASLLTRALGLTGDGEHEFDDVPADGTHAGAIDAIADHGITRGCTETKFCPGDDVTRAQMASFLAAAFDIAHSENDRFTDVDGVHEPAINGIAEAGITAGCDTDRFCPGDPLSRAQMATFLTRAMGLDPVDPEPPLDGSILTGSGERLVLYPAGGGPGSEVAPPIDDFPRWGYAMIPGTNVLSYTRDQQVRTVDLDDASTDHVLADGNRPVWSDDGRYVAVVRRNILTTEDGAHYEECCADVAILDRGGELVRQIRVDGHDLRATDWSPDGTTIVARMREHDSPVGGGIVEIDVASGEVTVLTPVAGDHDHAATYAPDGTIAYLRASASRYNRDTYLRLRSAAGDERWLGVGDGYEWSPSGDRLLRVVPPADGEFTDEVEVIDRTGEVLATLVTAVAGGTAWGPDGRYVAVSVATGDPRTSETRTPSETWIHAADGSDAWLLTPADRTAVDWFVAPGE